MNNKMSKGISPSSLRGAVACAIFFIKRLQFIKIFVFLQCRFAIQCRRVILSAITILTKTKKY